MKKFLVAFLLLLFSFSSISYGEAPDPAKWHYSSSGAGRSYYLYIPDLQEANKIYTNNKNSKIFTIWTLVKSSDGSSVKAQDSFDLSSNRKVKILTIINYDKKGKVTNSYDTSKSGRWRVVPPDTILEKLYDDVVKWVKSE